MITLETRKLTDQLVRLERVADSLPEIAQQASAESLGHLIVGARRNIYDTQAGAYERTQDLLRDLFARPQASRNRATVEVRGMARYQSAVELGTGATALTLPQVQAYALANPNPEAALYYGRSGLNYSLPGPIVAPAQAFALFRMKQLFVEAVKRVK